MRISTAYQYDSYSANIMTAQQRLLDDQQQVQTGKAFTKPSENPTGTNAVINMQSLSDSIDQYAKNLNNAKGWLNSTDNALSGMQTTLQQGYQAALQGANTTTSQDSRTQLANQISQLQAQLVSLGNSKSPTGQYLFGGQVTQTAPFTVDLTGMVFHGDTSSISMQGSPTQHVDVNSAGSPLITDAYSRLEAIRQSLLNGDTASLSNTNLLDIQKSMQAVSLERGAVGVKINSAKTLDSQNSQRKDDLTTNISNVQDVDMSQAITQYQLANTAYQAALQVASKGYSLSLMDFIK